MQVSLSFTPQLLFEDNHLLVIEKPVNLLSQADHSGSPDLLSLLKDWIKQRDQKPGQVFLGLVQRLDRPVGGVMVFAKTSKAASRLADQVRQRTLQKTYLAVVAGVVDPPEWTLTDWLQKDRHSNTVRVVESGVSQAKQAILHYERIAVHANKSLLRIQLETGRSHQIRVQLVHCGHPLLGDHKYGQALNLSGPALWSHQLQFQHPILRKFLLFTSFPPKTKPWQDFKSV
ncbi:MAG TPA: RNA pseudouridine synthase [Deltaproteobacteria bacterium]|nr:RNA pseudouridine synthase [Deltaproteobacteria bacterium]